MGASNTIKRGSVGAPKKRYKRSGKGLVNSMSFMSNSRLKTDLMVERSNFFQCRTRVCLFVCFFEQIYVPLKGIAWGYILIDFIQNHAWGSSLIKIRLWTLQQGVEGEWEIFKRRTVIRST